MARGEEILKVLKARSLHRSIITLTLGCWFVVEIVNICIKLVFTVRTSEGFWKDFGLVVKLRNRIPVRLN